MQKIKECYYNLIMIASSIHQYWISNVAVHSFLNMAEPRKLDPDIFPHRDIFRSFEYLGWAVKGFIIIQTCAFIDEYGLLQRLPVEDVEQTGESIHFKKEVKAILRTAVNFIRGSWKDLYQVRNNLLAHGWRDDSGSAIMFTDMPNHVPNVPWIDEEFTLLVAVFSAIIDVLRSYKPHFMEDLNTFLIERNQNKVHHKTRSLNHENSLEMARAVRKLMELELQLIRANIG